MNPTVAGPDPREMTEAQLLGRIASAYKAAPRMRAVDLNDDPSVLARIKHVLKPNEKLLQFFARTGLGRTQALTMTRAEVSQFVEQVERNRQQEASTAHFEPRGIPARLVIEEV